MSRKSGYFICYRNIWQHPVFKNLLQASCWIYMISSASHQDKNLRFLDNKIRLVNILRRIRNNFEVCWGVV